MAWNTEPRSAVLKTACVTLAGPIISADVVRLCGSNSRGALPELSGIGVVGIAGGEVLLGWNVFGAEVLLGAGVGEPIDGTVIDGDPIDGAVHALEPPFLAIPSRAPTSPAGSYKFVLHTPALRKAALHTAAMHKLAGHTATYCSSPALHLPPAPWP